MTPGPAGIGLQNNALSQPIKKTRKTNTMAIFPAGRKVNPNTVATQQQILESKPNKMFGKMKKRFVFCTAGDLSTKGTDNRDTAKCTVFCLSLSLGSKKNIETKEVEF